MGIWAKLFGKKKPDYETDYMPLEPFRTYPKGQSTLVRSLSTEEIADLKNSRDRIEEKRKKRLAESQYDSTPMFGMLYGSSPMDMVTNAALLNAVLSTETPSHAHDVDPPSSEQPTSDAGPKAEVSDPSPSYTSSSDSSPSYSSSDSSSSSSYDSGSSSYSDSGSSFSSSDSPSF